MSKITRVFQGLSAKYSSHRSDVHGYVIIVFAAAMLMLGVYAKTTSDWNKALEAYKKLSDKETEVVTKSVGFYLRQIYQGLRTISQLSGVRAIDRYGAKLDLSAREAIISIYNNMVLNVAISEIYIVPVGLNPEEIDPHTGSLQTPILMFDDKATAIVKQGDDGDKEKITTIAQAEAAPEVEIYEYRLLKEQLAYLSENYGVLAPDKAEKTPMVAGHEVLTCDNSEYMSTKNNSDRTGLVFSVPFYGSDNHLKGTITAVVRNNGLRNILPETDVALINPTYGYTLFPKGQGQERLSSMWISMGLTDPDLHYSGTNIVDSPDPRAQWLLWAGHPNSAFSERNEVKSIRRFALFSYGIIILGALAGCFIFYTIRRNLSAMTTMNADLERRAIEVARMSETQEAQKADAEREKRAALDALAKNFEGTVGGVVKRVTCSVMELEETAQRLASLALQTEGQASAVATSSGVAANNTTAVASVTEKLASSIGGIAKRADDATAIAKKAVTQAEETNVSVVGLKDAAAKIGQVTNLISTIARQTNLLALNATIEAARAGEMGKGFAVVANEVKTLANQTAKATDEISVQIQAMQDATDLSAQSIQQIGSTIEQLNTLADGVVSAVQEQRLATDEMARNINDVAGGVNTVASSISSVTQAAGDTKNSVQQVMDTATSLADDVSKLQQEVTNFLAMVRGKTPA